MPLCSWRTLQCHGTLWMAAIHTTEEYSSSHLFDSLSTSSWYCFIRGPTSFSTSDDTFRLTSAGFAALLGMVYTAVMMGCAVGHASHVIS